MPPAALDELVGVGQGDVADHAVVVAERQPLWLPGRRVGVAEVLEYGAPLGRPQPGAAVGLVLNGPLRQGPVHVVADGQHALAVRAEPDAGVEAVLVQAPLRVAAQHEDFLPRVGVQDLAHLAAGDRQPGAVRAERHVHRPVRALPPGHGHPVPGHVPNADEALPAPRPRQARAVGTEG
jgi:hypothetical protein